MAGVAGGHREAARKCRLRPGRLRSDRLGDRSVQAAAALLQILAGPLLRKGDGKADAVRFAIRSGALIDHAIDAATRRQYGSGRTSTRAARTGRAAGRHRFRARDFQSHARAFELCHVRTLGIRRAKAVICIATARMMAG